jgi:hypothetical protein
VNFCFKRELFISVMFSSMAVLLLTPCAWAAPSIEWEGTFGGSQSDYLRSIQQTRDGGYIAAGSSWSSDGDVTNNHGKDDFWVVKLKENGTLLWQKSFGGSDRDAASSIQETSDGGYIVAGCSRSKDGDVTNNYGKDDFWVVKLKEDGALDWEKSFGGSDFEYASSIQQTKDGGYILAGTSRSKDGDVSDNHGDTDFLVVKLKEDGTLEWKKSLGGSNFEYASSIRQTKDGGYVLAGTSISGDGDVSSGSSLNGEEFWVVKLTEDGTLEWGKQLGGAYTEYASSIQQTKDGGYILVGTSGSKQKIAPENHGSSDLWIVKLKENGVIDWEKSIGSPKNDQANSIQQSRDGGYIVGGEFPNEAGASDFWVVKLKDNGTVDWQRTFGGSGIDKAYSIQQTQDGGYIVAGESQSDDGDVHKNQGKDDFWIVKLKVK